jgi:hypothetical protein
VGSTTGAPVSTTAPSQEISMFLFMQCSVAFSDNCCCLQVVAHWG